MVKRNARSAFTLLEVLAAVLVVSVGFAGVVLWLDGHSQVQSREARSWFLLRTAQNAYERSMAFPDRVADSSWEVYWLGQRYTASLHVLDSLEWPDDFPYRPWPREVALRICVSGSEFCPLDWFWAVGGVGHAR